MVNLSAPAHPLPSSGLAHRTGSSAIRDLLALTERPDVLSLAGGLPSPAGFPLVAIAEVTAQALAEDGPAALQYGPTEGYGPLRAWIAAHHPVTAARDQVLVTHGSQQAIELVARAVVAPGATVALADALSAIAKPVIEVHISNVHRREAFRHHSYVSAVAEAVICGCGTDGYLFALQRLSALFARGAAR